MHRLSYFVEPPFNSTHSHIFKIMFFAKLDRTCNLPGVPLDASANEFQQDLVSTIIGTYMNSNVMKWVSFLNTFGLDDLNKKSFHH